jgi:hypothetical protein
MSDGVLYLAWDGPRDVTPILQRSIDSLKATNPNLAHTVVRLPAGSTLLDKAGMYDLSPFDTTLFLDADTVVLADVSPLFDALRWHGVICTVCECPWACRFEGLKQYPNLVEYNTGVLGWRRMGAAEDVFRRWKYHASRINSQLNWESNGQRYVMPENDQASFAYAMNECRVSPFALPINWNFRPRWHHGWFGPVKIWHDYEPVPPKLIEFNRTAKAMDFAVARFLQ